MKLELSQWIHSPPTVNNPWMIPVTPFLSFSKDQLIWSIQNSVKHLILVHFNSLHFQSISLKHRSSRADIRSDSRIWMISTGIGGAFGSVSFDISLFWRAGFWTYRCFRVAGGFTVAGTPVENMKGIMVKSWIGLQRNGRGGMDMEGWKRSTRNRYLAQTYALTPTVLDKSRNFVFSFSI
jgi:hypothetical protein